MNVGDIFYARNHPRDSRISGARIPRGLIRCSADAMTVGSPGTMGHAIFIQPVIHHPSTGFSSSGIMIGMVLS
jgi:hypothetical protein